MAKKSLYKVVFVNQGKVYEIYARHVGQGELYGFVEVKDLVFGARSRVVVDPAEEKLRNEFDGVGVTYVPIHSVVRIDRVEREGTAKIIPLSERTDSGAGAVNTLSTLATPPRPGKHD
jgi:hypothetical protein